jgi:cytochrome b involved in lipid metabolism
MKKIITSIIIVAIIIIGIMHFKNINTKTNPIPQNFTSRYIKPVSTTTPSVTLKMIKINEVALHNKPTDCWTSINGKIYDLTAFASKHPGGDKAIFSICGIDGSKAFNGQHGGQEKPEMVLKGFDIGTLVQ